jgi:hypothetical protein
MLRAAALYVILLFGPAVAVRAQSPASPSAQHETVPAPILSHQTHWVEPFLIGTAAFFAIATIVGILYRRTQPREMLPVHAHDEPPGASHRHGDSGTVE